MPTNAMLPIRPAPHAGGSAPANPAQPSMGACRGAGRPSQPANIGSKHWVGDSGGLPCLMAIRKLGLARDLLSEVRFVEVGIVHEEGPRERVFKDPTSEPRPGFLKWIIEAGRL